MGYYSSGYIASGYYTGSSSGGEVHASANINTITSLVFLGSHANKANIETNTALNVVSTTAVSVLVISHIESVAYGSIDIPNSMIAWTERIGMQQITQQREIDQLRLDSLNHLTGPDIQPLFNGREVIFHV